MGAVFPPFSEIFDRTQKSPTLVPPFYYYILNLYANYFKATLSDARELSKNIQKEKIDEEKEK